MNIDELLALSPVIPVVTIRQARHAAPLARALLAGGVTVIEVTLRTQPRSRRSSGSAPRWPA